MRKLESSTSSIYVCSWLAASPLLYQSKRFDVTCSYRKSRKTLSFNITYKYFVNLYILILIIFLFLVMLR